MGQQMAMVDYLVLDGGPPHLVANKCTGCGATYLDRRNACGRGSGTSFDRVPLARGARSPRSRSCSGPRPGSRLRMCPRSWHSKAVVREAGDRQIDGAKVGLTHVIGLGSACSVHILEKAS